MRSLHSTSPPSYAHGDATARSGAAEAEEDRSSLIEGLWHETGHLAIRSAAVASLLNSLDYRRAPLSGEDARSALALTSADLPIATAITSHLISAPLPIQTVDLLRKFYATVVYGCTGLRAAASAKGAEARTAVQEAAQTWREVTGLALSLIYDLELAAGTAAPHLAVAATPELTAVLREARRGGWPCIDADGRPFIPNWAQKRLYPRRPLNTKALLEHAGSVYDMEICDVSAGGFGITSAWSFKTGTDVTVILDDGERLPARVAWAAGRQAGLQLEAKLAPRHRLLGFSAPSGTAR